MSILPRNGRVFEGGPLDIVAGMRARAEAFELSIGAFADRMARELRASEGVDMDIEGGTTAWRPSASSWGFCNTDSRWKSG